MRDLHIQPEQLRGFCERHHIRQMRLFGSVLRDDFTEESDLDILVDFEPDQHIGLIALGIMAEELSALVGRNVDLNTSGTLSRHFRDEVLREAEVIYDAA